MANTGQHFETTVAVDQLPLHTRLICHEFKAELESQVVESTAAWVKIPSQPSKLTFHAIREDITELHVDLMLRWCYRRTIADVIIDSSITKGPASTNETSSNIAWDPVDMWKATNILNGLVHYFTNLASATCDINIRQLKSDYAILPGKDSTEVGRHLMWLVLDCKKEVPSMTFRSCGSVSSFVDEEGRELQMSDNGSALQVVRNAIRSDIEMDD